MPNAAQAALVSVSALRSSVNNLLIGQGCEHVDAAAGEQRGNHFEGRILGGRADQPDGAALDVGQKGVLLGCD